MNKKEVKGRKKKERDSRRFGSLSGLNFKAFSSWCFKNKGLLFSAFTWVREGLLSHSLPLMKEIQNCFNCPSSRVEKGKKQNHDASDFLLLSDSFLLTEFEIALRIWDTWNRSHLRATYIFLSLWTKLNWSNKSQIFCPSY